MRSNIVFVSVAAAALLSSAPDAFAGFADATAEAGISSAQAQSRAAEAPAAGAAIDVDSDGWPDFIAARAGNSPALYANNGDGTFSEQSAARGLAAAKGAASFAAGDFDNDGDQDIVAASESGAKVYLLVNDGTGKFSDEAARRVPASALPKGAAKGLSIGVVDYDLDGFVDIYLGGWQPADADSEPRAALWRNRGAAAPGQFEDATAATGLSRGAGRAMATAWADLDGDVWPDLVAVSGSAHWSEGGGRYARDAGAGLALDGEGRGVAVADFDGDGALDVFVSAGATAGNKLFRNLGARSFEDVGHDAGLAIGGAAWGAAPIDSDNDGHLDLLVAGSESASIAALFVNDGSGAFSAEAVDAPGSGKALLVMDYDRDGDEDAVVLDASGNVTVLKNDASDNGMDWIRLTLEGTASNRDAIGATARVVDAGVSRIILLNPANGALGQREAAMHFGLGQSDGIVDQVVITWPNGSRQVVYNQEVNKTLHVIEADNLPAPPRFLTQPASDLAMGLGQTMTLSVDVVGQEGALFIWEKDGVPLARADSASLRIPRFSPLDAGVYQVSASNPAGALFSPPVCCRPATRSWNCRWPTIRDARTRERRSPGPTASTPCTRSCGAGSWRSAAVPPRRL